MATRGLRTPSILLVSHSVDERELYARPLRAAGYRVVGATTTAVAYQAGTTQKMDIVVTESYSPGSMSGLQLTRRFRVHTRTKNLPIIVLTNVTRRQDAELSIKAGADIFLERPVSGEVLREHVTRLLVSCGRLSRQSSHHDVSRPARPARNSRGSQPESFSQGGPAAPAPQSPADVNVSGGDNRHLTCEGTCPECGATLVYRQKTPILTVRDPNARKPHERLRYVSGWFCSNTPCEYGSWRTLANNSHFFMGRGKHVNDSARSERHLIARLHRGRWSRRGASRRRVGSCRRR